MDLSWPRTEELVEKARRFAALAISDYAAERHDAFALNAGTAFEALGKALLVQRGVSIWVPEKPRPGTRRRTISARVVLEKICEHYPENLLDEEDVKLLIEERNEAAHLVRLTRGARAALGRLYRACNALLRLFDDPSHSHRFWTIHQSMVGTLADLEHGDEVQARLGMKRLAARGTLTQRFHGFERRDLEELRRRATETVTDRAYEYGSVVECPVCEFPAVVTGPSDWYDVGDDGEYYLMEADDLRCAICELHLVSTTEIAAAGLRRLYQAEEPQPPDQDHADADDDPDRESNGDAHRWLWRWAGVEPPRKSC